MPRKKRHRRKRLSSQRKMLLFFFLAVFGISLLLYWLVHTLSDPVYKDYTISLPAPLHELPTQLYDWEKLQKDTDFYRYEDDHYQAVLGIDVSQHNGDIDWSLVYDSGVRFAYLRVGFRGYGNEGVIVKDERFEEYYREAKKAGLRIGVYFFSQAMNHEEAMEEAFYTLEMIRHKEIDLPVGYDLESIDYATSRIESTTHQRKTENALIFAQKIQENGKKAIIYTNRYWMEEIYDPYMIYHHSIWYAQYGALPTWPYHFQIWQYSDKGHVPGIENATDLNLLFLEKNAIVFPGKQ